MPDFDQRSFRSALGRFATGVTIITARGSDGRPVGVTANSFNSVSLDPPLILWSLNRSSSSLDAYQSAEEFAVHVLGMDQEELSNRFATGGVDKFAGIDVGDSGVPLLEGCNAFFKCQKVQQHEVGDHVLFIGEVLEFSTQDTAPLLYLHGRYGEARRNKVAQVSYDLEAARLGQGAILNLFSYAYVGILGRLRDKFAALGLEQPIPIALVAIAEGANSIAEIERAAIDRDFRFSAEHWEEMRREGLAELDGDSLRLLPKGEELHRDLIFALKDVEDQLESEFTVGELAEAKHFLAKIGNLSVDF